MRFSMPLGDKVCHNDVLANATTILCRLYKTMSIQRDTRRYENWLRKQCRVVEHDLDRKHKRMASSSFMFLRATYYRWARKIEEWSPELSDAPHILAVGDVHTENFGIWRDKEGRLVWGINDFDEAAPMPYIFDLVRLAASARLAPGLPLTSAQVSAAILDGYKRGLKKPRPTLLAERKAWMRPLLDYSGKDSKRFWRKVGKYPKAKPHPKAVGARLRESLPRHADILRFCRRSVGGGSLGRPRFVAVAQWRGGHVLREAKAFVTSAWHCAHDELPDHSSFMKLAHGRYRSPSVSGNAGSLHLPTHRRRRAKDRAGGACRQAPPSRSARRHGI